MGAKPSVQPHPPIKVKAGPMVYITIVSIKNITVGIANILTRSVFGAISIGNGLVAAVLLCMKWERSYRRLRYFGYNVCRMSDKYNHRRR